MSLKGMAVGSTFAVPAFARRGGLSRVDWGSFLPYVGTGFAVTDGGGRSTWRTSSNTGRLAQRPPPIS